ncbi:hypothetical protein QAD02_024298 [Eretmocerus hayati]|uniref:Uncharacterized protein n=1 Tax=Eretmocerus hayati TaxID=131215 RepID=A0ACC2PZD2_9HYME|nr:hypothetical protein QAD02_024298 [Eretmocerus hayati]
MSGRDCGSISAYPGGGTRSPRSGRRLGGGELPTVDRSPSRGCYGQQQAGAAGPGSSQLSYIGASTSPKQPRLARGGASPAAALDGYGLSGGPLGYGPHQQPLVGYRDEMDLCASPSLMLEERGRSMSQGARSRSASRPLLSGPRYACSSLDRASVGLLDHEREFVPIRDPLLASSRRAYMDDPATADLLYSSSMGARMGSGGGVLSARTSPHMLRGALGGDPGSAGYIGELQHQNNDLQRELGNLKKELELTNQKLGSSMHSIKTFWSPELKKERALRKEESTKYSLINEQLKLLNSENQVGVLPRARYSRWHVCVQRPLEPETAARRRGLYLGRSIYVCTLSASL